jgi:hypothetical protein
MHKPNKKELLGFIKEHKVSFFILVLFCVFAALFLVFSRGEEYSPEEMEYGITFSKLKAQDLGLDWKEAYTDILDELELKKIRIPAYWNEIEEVNNDYYFEDLDWQVNEASKRGVDIILAIGGRLPRWPECHFPGWSEKISKKEKQEELLEYIERIISRYKDEKNIKLWQVENEPFLSSHFGECPPTDVDFLDKEIEKVRSLDDRPIVVTDSGELSLWFPAARRADVFGTTMYKKTYSERLGMYVDYPIGPWFFHLKRNLADLFAEPDKWIVIELQAEPWAPIPYQKIKKEERERTMDGDKFEFMVDLAGRSGFKEVYLWGAEYWYWEKEKNGNYEMWNKAKDMFLAR